MELVDIYVDRRAVAKARMKDDQLEDTVQPRRARPARWRVEYSCPHWQPVPAFAHRRSRDEHWPVVYCDDCLEILAGRDPLVRSTKRPRWKFDERNAVATRWAREWPKRGRPRSNRPPESVAWPDAA